MWKSIPGYEGLYEVSSKGRVRSLDRTVPHKRFGEWTLKGKVLEPRRDSSGYIFYALSKDGKVKDAWAHTLVALVFIGERPKGIKGEEIRHLDNDKDNNHYKNLCYGSRSSNQEDRIKSGNNNYGIQHPSSKLTFMDVGKIRKLLIKGKSRKSISAMYDVHIGTVDSIAQENTWSPSKYNEYLQSVKENSNEDVYNKIKKELKIITPKGWSDWIRNRTNIKE
jgi:NUMOD4 motif/HNH endonuclease